MEEKRLRPLEILYEFILALLLIVLVEVCIVFAYVTEGIHFNISDFFIFSMIRILLIIILINEYHKQLIIVCNNKVIIEKKIKEWENGKAGKWIVQRDEIITNNISRIGYSLDLYGKELYFYRYKNRGYRSEIVIEMKNGEKSTFDIYFFVPWQQAIILKALTANSEVIITGSLKETMSQKALKMSIPKSKSYIFKSINGKRKCTCRGEIKNNDVLKKI